MQGVFSVKSMVYYAIRVPRTSPHSCYSSYSLVAACSSRECLKLVLVLWGRAFFDKN